LREYLFASPHALQLHFEAPDGRKLYTANGLSNDVTVVDTVTNKVVATIKAGDGPWGIAL